MSHIPISPAIHYWGTPVVLISSLNPNGTTNIAPMSSAFWLANRCILGLASFSQTPQNMLRTKQCVLNLPSSSMGDIINGVANTTGTKDVPEWKKAKGTIYVEDKWTRAGVTPQDSDLVEPKRIKECPVQMECEVVTFHKLMEDLAPSPAAEFVLVIEVKVLKVHVNPGLVMEGHRNRIDTDKWKPMFMMFQQLYGLGDGMKVKSKLAEDIDEEEYRDLTDAGAGEGEKKRGVEEVTPGMVVPATEMEQ